MKYILTALLMIMSFASYAEVPTIDLFEGPAKLAESTEILTIETTAFQPGQTMSSIMGEVVGLEYPPLGDYRARITNGKKFKAERFSLMTCKLKSYIEDIDYDMENAIPLSTAFGAKDGTLYNFIGWYSGSTAYPSDGYKVIVRNGKDKQFWNSMDCKIK